MKTILVILLCIITLIKCKQDNQMVENSIKQVIEPSGIELEDYSIMVKADNAIPQPKSHLPYIRLYDCSSIIKVGTVIFMRESLEINQFEISVESGKILKERGTVLPKDQLTDFIAFIEKSKCELLPSMQNMRISGGKLFIVKTLFKRFNIFSLKGIADLEGKEGQVQFVKEFKAFIDNIEW